MFYWRIHMNTEICQLIAMKQEGSYWDFKKEWYNKKSDLLHDIICLSNNLVNITFNFHRLLSGHEPILATVIEKRQNIAQLIHHRCQKLTFSELHIRI